jgi:hypothetical protein
VEEKERKNKLGGTEMIDIDKIYQLVKDNPPDLTSSGIMAKFNIDGEDLSFIDIYAILNVWSSMDKYSRKSLALETSYKDVARKCKATLAASMAGANDIMGDLTGKHMKADFSFKIRNDDK